MAKLLNHDDYVKDLVEILRSEYLIVQQNVQFGYSSIILGEIDVLAINHDTFDLYEVKSSSDIGAMKKAADQLILARSYLGHQGKSFIYTPKNRIQSLGEVLNGLKKKKRDYRSKKF